MRDLNLDYKLNHISGHIYRIKFQLCCFGVIPFQNFITMSLLSEPDGVIICFFDIVIIPDRCQNDDTYLFSLTWFACGFAGLAFLLQHCCG